MARKVETLVCASEGRDQGKVYVLTEMSAYRAEKWAARALLALAGSGVDIPEDVASEGMATIARVGFSMLAGAKFADIEPLMDEMLDCVRIARDPKRPDITFPLNLTEDATDVEELATLPWLRGEALKLHVDFSKLVARSKPPGGTEDDPPSGPQTSPT